MYQEHLQDADIHTSDLHPLLLMKLQPGADELRVGQLSVEGDYCVLCKEPDSELLKHIKIND